MKITVLIGRYIHNVKSRKDSTITRLVVHHDAGRRPSAKHKVIPRLDAYDKQHDDQGGIPYPYVIDPWGEVYKTRKTSEIVSHVRNNNTKSLGIMLMGCFHPLPADPKNNVPAFPGEKPTAAQLKSLEALIRELAGALPNITHLTEHRKVPGSRTACPGNLFPYELLVRLRKELDLKQG